MPRSPRSQVHVSHQQHHLWGRISWLRCHLCWSTLWPRGCRTEWVTGTTVTGENGGLKLLKPQSIWHHMAISRGFSMGTYDYELLDQLDLNMDTPWIPHFWTKWCQDWWLHMALECSKLIQVARATCNTCWTVLTSPRHFGAGAAAERSPCHIRSWSRIISYNYIYI